MGLAIPWEEDDINKLLSHITALEGEVRMGKETIKRVEFGKEANGKLLKAKLALLKEKDGEIERLNNRLKTEGEELQNSVQ